jgi:arylsulfatase A-like enzyme
MSYRAPHGHERYISNKELYSDKGWPEKERMHAAKITLLDKQIGRLLSKLEEMGELENTLVFFTSDNGPHNVAHDREFFNSNGQLKGHKRDLYEGGVRVPTMAFWKGTIKAGSVSNFIGSGQDFMPTIAEVAEIATPEQSNGISILPLLKGETVKKDRAFLNWEFHRIGPAPRNFRQSARIGKMKGVRYGSDAPIEIYNLEGDISEAPNLAEDHPALVERMDKIFSEERTDSNHFPYRK